MKEETRFVCVSRTIDSGGTKDGDRRGTRTEDPSHPPTDPTHPSPPPLDGRGDRTRIEMLPISNPVYLSRLDYQ